jgi:hypothetical protein
MQHLAEQKKRVGYMLQFPNPILGLLPCFLVAGFHLHCPDKLELPYSFFSHVTNVDLIAVVILKMVDLTILELSDIAC